MEKVWKLLVRGSRAIAKLDAVFGGDRPDGRRIECGEPNFAQAAGDIGQQLVEKLDEGCVPEAFAAWCSVFMEEFEELKGRETDERLDIVILDWNRSALETA